MEDAKILAIFSAVIAGIFGVIIWAGLSVESAQCVSRWPDRNPSYSFFEGCMIDTSEGRIPSSNFRVL